MESATAELKSIFEYEQFVHYPTHYALAESTLKKAWENNLAFVCGTNLLRSYWKIKARKNQWSLRFIDAFRMQPAILFGVGWNNYTDETEWKAKVFYKNALRKDILHSVRDSYTENKLKRCGIKNVINTGCPTLWSLTSEKLSSIPTTKASSVVFTLTDYRRNYDLDISLINCLTKNYETIYFWPQGSKDLAYFEELNLDSSCHNNQIKLVSNTLIAFNEILVNNDIDYIGTRLHAGIRALQLSKRAIIIGIDNRAVEMKNDFNLPVVNRVSIEELIELINTDWAPSLNIPWTQINNWKAQFINLNLGK